MCLAQGHNTVTQVRLEPTASQSQVKHSTTELHKELVFNVPPTTMVIWRQGYGLESHPTDLRSWGLNLETPCYKANGLSTSP